VPLIAYCGLDCEVCPARIATLADDRALRAATAEKWSKDYDAEIRPEDVNCTGCTDVAGAKIGHCFECGIRLCAMDREIDTCAGCGDYPCGQLEQFFTWVPPARETLDALRSQGS